MVERTMQVADAGRGFAHLIDEVVAHRDHIIVERDGEAVAAVVPIALYQQWKNERDALFASIERTARRVNMSEADALALALEGQRATRAQQRSSD